jgi:predicted transcriptional regulator
MVPLAPTEWLLMRCVWDLGEANPLEVAEHLTHRYCRDFEAKTVGILLARLVRKGYLRFTPGLVVRGRPPHVYSPLVTPEAAMRRQVEQFLEDHVIGVTPRPPPSGPARPFHAV